MKGEEITITGVGNNLYCISEIKKTQKSGYLLERSPISCYSRIKADIFISIFFTFNEWLVLAISAERHRESQMRCHLLLLPLEIQRTDPAFYITPNQMKKQEKRRRHMLSPAERRNRYVKCCKKP